MVMASLAPRVPVLELDARFAPLALWPAAAGAALESKIC